MRLYLVSTRLIRIPSIYFSELQVVFKATATAHIYKTYVDIVGEGKENRQILDCQRIEMLDRGILVDANYSEDDSKQVRTIVR